MSDDLRQRARERLRGDERPGYDPEHLSTADARALVEELRVHQFELEIQNEELRETQLQLTDSRDRFRTLYDFAPVGYFILDTEGGIAEPNRAAGAILGMEPARLQGVRFGDFVAAESWWHWREHLRAAPAQDSQPRCELALHNVAGDRWFVELHSQLDEKRAGSLRCAISDITARRRAERNLKRQNDQLEERVVERTAESRQSEARMRAILETMSSAIVTVTDGPGRIERANPAAEHMFGYTDGELAGRPFGPLLPEPYRGEYERHMQGWSDRAADNVAARREIAARRRDGAIFPVEVAVSSVDEAGLFIVAIRDLTEPRRLQNEVLNAAEAERFRISSELHDNVGQQLAGLAMMASGLARGRADGSERAADAEELSRELQRAVTALRTTVHDLTPMDLAGRDLPTALRTLADESGERSGIRCTFLAVDSPAEPEPRVAVQLLRIAGEALHNALEHAHPRLVGIELEGMEGGIMLSIHDDGDGMDADAADHSGMGTRTMRYRAGVIGANLEVGNRPEGGVLVRCTLPVSPARPL